MMELGTGLVLTAGTMTFVNEWWQTKQANWRVPVATLLLAAGIDFLSKLDNKISNGLGVMIFIGAGVTKFNGKSAFDTLSDLFGGANPPKTTRKG